MTRLVIILLGLFSTITASLAFYLFEEKGYLNRYEMASMLFDQPPPQQGSVGQLRDQAIFTQTRLLEGSARWNQAIRDADLSFSSVLPGFECATGRRLQGQNVPHFMTMLQKFDQVSSYLMRQTKKTFQVERPYIRYQGNVCSMSKGYDYPSGHAMYGWVMARLLIAIYPERYQQIEAHALSFAESRVVCGVHSASAVEASDMYVQILFEQLSKDDEFKEDMALAKKEMMDMQKLTKSEKCEVFPVHYIYKK